MSLTQRYFMFLSYIGTGFRGSQLQPNHITVQGVLQEALKYTLKKPCLLSAEEENNLKVILASRTDTGVHATKAGVHVDIPLKDKSFVKPYQLQFLLNKFMSKRGIFVRVSDCLLVPDTFHAKLSVLDKTYCYRVAINNGNHSLDNFSFPVTELNHTHLVVSKNFDYNIAKEVASLFVGVKDFATFCARPSRNLIKSSICNVISSDFEKTHPLLPDLDWKSQNFTYYAFKCRGNRFLYQMVRRIVSTILAASTKRITIDKVRSMIEKPEPSSWTPSITLFPGNGLHLINTIYKPEHFLFSEKEVAIKEPYWSQNIEDPDELERLVRLNNIQISEIKVKYSTESSICESAK